MIRLVGVGKTYDDGTVAVHELDLDVEPGEMVVLVGPSGCGKSTTLKMINRLIEPTTGRIFIDGQDVTTVDPVKLRRGIGYVIQQIGLFPHQKILRNVMTVPLLYGESTTTATKRARELLDVVGLDPDTYGDRYPHQLSGGQRQRVGVARALAADPPVLLMDEPFGAVDPVVRIRLQDEFLRLQRDLGKTVVLVTHDIDEAVRMGDRVAIFETGGRLAQYGTPAELLGHPADDFVEDFIGSGASIKRLSLSQVRDIETADWPVTNLSDGPDAARAKLQDSGREHVLLLDERRHPKRWVSRDDLEAGNDLEKAGWPAVAVVEDSSSLYYTLDTMITSYKGAAIVVDDDGAYLGVVDFDTVLEAINTMRPAEGESLQDSTPPEVRPGTGADA